MLGGLVDEGKRVIAVATHTHYDHVGGMHEFGERLVHPREQELLAGKGSSPACLRRTFLRRGDRRYKTTNTSCRKC